MIEQDFLSIYNENIYFNMALSFFNIFTYFITVLFFSYLSIFSFGVLNSKSIVLNKYMVNKNKLQEILDNNFLLITYFFALILTLLNYMCGIYINMIGWILWSILISISSFKFFKRTSAKWIFFSSTIFIISLISIYCLFWYMMNEQNSHIFVKFNLNNYEIHYKSFWSIYKLNDVHFNYFLFYDEFNKKIIVDNTIPYKRDLIYYYILYSIALSFWFYILNKIIKYHKLFNDIKK